ncbi:unnamed protein product [Blepharisma stoltei]|uniref:Cyclic nucleotide-binding domain-containing protein n=1 Tax=Blepharisma stoltei TaxID=1481888 RepID=A0AAU9KBB4_9CILI|nr:unnamed protein product [Blepharisma stoltei]
MNKSNEYKKSQTLKPIEYRRASQPLSPLRAKQYQIVNPFQRNLSAVTKLKRRPYNSIAQDKEQLKAFKNLSSDEISKSFSNSDEKHRMTPLNFTKTKCISASEQNLSYTKTNTNASKNILKSDSWIKIEDMAKSRRNSFNPPLTFKKIIPEWLLSRSDFYATYMKMKQQVGLDLGEVCSSAPSERTEDEKEALIKWVSNTRFFSAIPKVIVQETCDKFSVLEFSPGAQIIKKDDIADCMYLIYFGMVGIYVDGIRIGQRSQGESLGETALDNIKLRSADAFSETNVVLFKLKKIDYEHIILNLKKLEKHEYTKFIMTIPFFQRWSFIKVQNLSNLLIQSVYNPGDVIYEKGDQSATFYIIKEGSIQLQTYTHLEWQNKWPVGSRQWKLRKITNKFIYPLKTLLKGEFFGESEIISNCTRETRAVALEHSICLVLNKDEFLELFPPRELEILKQRSVLRMPSKQEMEMKIKQEMYSNEEKEHILLEAMRLGHGFEKGREFLLDARSKKLRGWYSSLKQRTRQQRAKIQSKIIDQKEENLNMSM